MELLLLCLSVLSFLLLAHSYVGYPFLLKILDKKDVPERPVFSRKGEKELPEVSVISSLYNEISVIEKKLETLFAQDYPEDKLHFYIGSDCSDDGTNALVQSWADIHPERLHFFPFTQRRGKPGVINELVETALKRKAAGQNHLFIITDANVLLSPETVFELAKHFRRPEIAIVDAHMIHTGMQSAGISQAENTYISSEVLLKHREGKLWGSMIGPFGGCYAIRSDYYSPVPPRYLVDDFYIAMRAFEQGGQAINELSARCYEAVSHDLQEEYRRKKRISAGNFQNMKTFRKLWWPPTTKLGFAFFSHKIIRWIGPFLLLFLLLSTGILALTGNLIYQTVFLILVGGLILLPLTDYFLQKISINILPLRGVRYFMSMNLALLEGFIKYLKGIKTNVWQPPKRN